MSEYTDTDLRNYYLNAMKCPYIQKAMIKCPFIKKHVDMCPWLSEHSTTNQSANDDDTSSGTSSGDESGSDNNNNGSGEQLPPITATIDQSGFMVPDPSSFYKTGRKSKN